MTLSRGDILTAVEAQRWIGGRKISTVNANHWLNLLEEKVNNIFIQLDPKRNLLRTTFSINKNASTESLPADFRMLDSPRLGFWVLDDNSEPKEENPLPQMYEGANMLGYYLEGETIYFTGFGETTKTVLMKYGDLFLPKGSWDASDTMLFPAQDEAFWQEFSMKFVKFKFFEDEEDMASETAALGKFEEMKDEISDVYQRDMSAVHYPDASDVYG